MDVQIGIGQFIRTRWVNLSKSLRQCGIIRISSGTAIYPAFQRGTYRAGAANLNNLIQVMLWVRCQDGGYLRLPGSCPGCHVTIVLQRPFSSCLIHKGCDSIAFQFLGHTNRCFPGAITRRLLLCYSLQSSIPKCPLLLPTNLKHFLNRLLRGS